MGSRPPYPGGKRPHAEGKNYRFDIEGGIVWCRVWARLDLDHDTGARCAFEKAEIIAQLVELPRLAARACLFDLREAPTNWGPKTHSALEKCFGLWERARRKIAVVTSGDPLQSLHAKQLVKDCAPKFGRVFATEPAARQWLMETNIMPAPGG
jgi:hypothetical protein